MCALERHAAGDLRLRVKLPAVPSSVPYARRLVRDVAVTMSVDAAWISDICLAVSEAAANVVLHAYAAEAAGTLDVSATSAGERLEVVVRDRGDGFGTPRNPGLGVGLLVMRRLAHECRIEPAHPGTKVVLAFEPPARA